MVCNSIKDDKDVVWKMVLLHKTITELVCSQVIYIEQSFNLDLLVEEYLFLRAKHFPDQLFRPKQMVTTKYFFLLYLLFIETIHFIIQ